MKYKDNIEKFLTEDYKRREFIEGILPTSKNSLTPFLLKNKDNVHEYNELAKLYFVFLWVKKTDLDTDLIDKDLLLLFLNKSKIYSKEHSAVLLGTKKRYNINTDKLLLIAKKVFKSDNEAHSLWLKNTINDLTAKMLKFILEDHKILSLVTDIKITPKNFSNFIREKEVRYKLNLIKDTDFFVVIKESFEKNKLKIKKYNESAYYTYINNFLLEELTETEKENIFNQYLEDLKFFLSEPYEEIKCIEKMSIFYKFFAKKEWKKIIESSVKLPEEYILKIKDQKKVIFNGIETENNDLTGLTIEKIIKLSKHIGFPKPIADSYSNFPLSLIENPKKIILETLNIEKNDSYNVIKNKLFSSTSYNGKYNKNDKEYLYSSFYLNSIPFEEIIFFKQEFNSLFIEIITIGHSKEFRWSKEAIDFLTEVFIQMDDKLNLSQEKKETLILNYKI